MSVAVQPIITPKRITRADFDKVVSELGLARAENTQLRSLNMQWSLDSKRRGLEIVKLKDQLRSVRAELANYTGARHVVERNVDVGNELTRYNNALHSQHRGYDREPD